MTGAFGAFIWLLAAAALFVVEGMTAQMVSIWFAAGALFAIIPTLLGAPLWVQLLVFLMFSILFLFVIRPMVKDKISVKKQPTNADMVVGQTGFVTEEIDNVRGTGRVTAMGLPWTARTEDDGTIPVDTQVVVKKIEGVKLIVEMKNI